MGQLRLVGEDAARALESLVPMDVVDLAVGKQRYAFFTGTVEKCVEKSITNVTRLLEPNYRPFCTRARRRPNHFAINTLTNYTAPIDSIIILHTVLLC